MIICDWCHGKDIFPVFATVQQITYCFIHLCKEKLFSVMAFKGYHFALIQVLALKGMDIVDCRELPIPMRIFESPLPFPKRIIFLDEISILFFWSLT